MLQSFSGRFGSFILGDISPPSPVREAPREGATASARMQAASSSSAGMGERPVPKPAEGLQLQCKFSSPAYGGVPVAKRSPHRQMRCTTCNQTLDDEEPMLKCHVCSSWMHDTCVEVLRIGQIWKADMCLDCQQTMNKQLKVIRAQEKRKAKHFDPDQWFSDFKASVEAGADHGATRNRDLNEVEIALARALISGLHAYKDNRPASTTDGDTANTDDLREQPGEPTPIATATGPFIGEPPQTAASSAAPADDPPSSRQDADRQPQEEMSQASLGQRTGLREERDTRPPQGQGDTQPVHRPASLHSSRSDQREERMSAIEHTMSSVEDKLNSLIQAIQSGALGSSDLRGPPPKAQPEQAQEGYERSPGYRRQTTPPQSTSNKVPYKANPQGSSDPSGAPKAAVPSPAYQVPEDSIWNQSYLAKALQTMKEADFAQLKFASGANKPVEYEKWVVRMDTTTHAQHTEIGLYWKRVVDCAQKSYAKYIKDVSYTRNCISPEERLPRNVIEERIESRLHMILNAVVPPCVVRQCDDKPDVSCALIMYRTMVHAGPASKEDVAQMLDILTRPRTYEVRKLQDAMIQFRYARTRLQKYGHTEPEPRQLFETLKMAAYSLTAKDPEFSFRFQLYLTQHSSVNGLVGL